VRRSVAVVRQTGGPEAITVVEDDLPEPVGAQAQVRVAFAGLNFWDIMQRRGSVPLGPGGTLGVEGVGTVVALGPEADAALLGQRVAWSKVGGSCASAINADSSALVPVPDGVSDEMAAGGLMQGITAQYLAESTTHLGAGQWAVVTAAAGGVGGLLTQMLVARGAGVIGVVGSEAKREAALAAGAAEVHVGTDGLAESVRALAPEGVDAVFDASGGDPNPLFGLLRPRGIVVIYGSASGSLDPIDPGALAGGSYYVTRTAGRDYSSAPGEWAERAADVMSRLADGRLRVNVGEVFALSDIRTAHERLESRQTVGKVLLQP